MISSPIDATAAASDWAPGRLVFIRLRRDTSVTNNQPSTFYLASVQLVYTPL